MPVAAHSTTPLYTDWRDRYELVGRIGSGGFAEVFEARDLVLNQRVALKVIPEGRAMSGRVVREVEAAAALSHPGIVALYDWFGDGERSILVWELVEGSSLAQLSGRLGDAEIVAVGAELLTALAFAHAQGIVHRDVKPQNVMLSDEGHVKVMDFGIARLLNTDTLTGDGDVIGTVAYMSPEQAAARRVGPPSDVYSAGMVLYELLAGRHPLRGDSPAETLANVAAARLPSLSELRPDLPPAVTQLIDDACASRPGERPSAAELAAALERVVREGQLRSRKLQKVQQLAQPLRRLAVAAERGGGAVLAAVAVGVVLGALPAYPSSWVLPLVAVSAAIWVVTPRAGLAWLLGVLAFPVFNVSLSLGLAYLVFAAVLFWLARERPIVALWPVLALLLMPVYLTLVAPAAAAVLGRVRGPLAAAWAGAATMVYLLLVRAPRGAFGMEQPRGRLGESLAAAGDPLTAASRLLSHVLTAPCLLQAALWAGLALAIGLALAAKRLETRLWIWALAFAGVFAAYRVLPVVVWHYPAAFWPLAMCVALSAGVIILPLILTANEAPQEGEDESLSVD